MKKHDKTNAADPRPRKKARLKWLCAVVALLGLAIGAGTLMWPGENPIVGSANALATASYPQMAAYPMEEDYWKDNGEFDSDSYMEAYDAWLGDQFRQREQAEGYGNGLEDFFTRSTQQFLSDAGQENRVYSPLNVYMALAMLAEITEQNSRQQILDLLGAADIDALRAQATALWNANYSNDGANTSVLASSLWLNEDIAFKQETLDRLAQTYYASSYQGEMGSTTMNRALQDWLNEQTGGLLEEQARQIELNPQTVLALATSIYYQAKWTEEFYDSATQPDTFYAASGEETCDFMHQSSNRYYYRAEQFSAVEQPLSESGSMWFVLPDEDVTVEELLQDAQLMPFLLADGQWENQVHAMVNLSVPKFDVTSSIDLTDGLQALGVTDVFDSAASDFSPLCDQEELAVSQAQHDARVMIDEEGCTAVAYTVMAADSCAALDEDEEIDFVLDRPFLFAITNRDGLPLFIGVVNHVV